MKMFSTHWRMGDF